MDRRYQETVQKREKEVRMKEAAAVRYAEAAARHEENARRKNEEATRRIREAELREQQLRAWEARSRKEIAQKEADVVRTRVRAPSTSAVPRMTRVFSEEWQQQQQRLRAGTGMPALPTSIAIPRREVKVRF
jgi:broad specificity phosphatase PhoE